MRFRLFMILLLLLAVLLSACRGETAQPDSTAVASLAATQTSEEFSSPSTTQAAAVSEATAVSEADQLESPTPAGPTAPPGCTVVSFLPAPDPTAQAAFPPPGENDWVQGPETAQVTITEYSDFQ